MYSTSKYVTSKMSITRPFRQILNRKRLHSTPSIEPSGSIANEYKDSIHTPISVQLSTPVEIIEYKSQPYKYAYNIILIGDSNVGKSCLKDYYLDREFNSCQPSTLVVDFQTAYAKVDDNNLVVNIWDAAGHSSFKMFASSYYKKCCAILLVFSLTDKRSFESIQNWLMKAKADSPAVVYVLIGNKVDAKDKREVSSADAREYAQFNDLYYYETTCMGGTSVEDMFYNTIQMLYKISTKTKQEGLKKLGIKVGLKAALK
ncbi:Ras-related protein rab-2a [Oopsacas minuta]|uniref:Ras-related protein rab-2a n=1 Tax=Oopsacas minuta TaxID=111878 RepID=A0AAV7KCX6_9METZ|nr:Ras-related protein rab-2a [Oopsacas minuta]